MIVVEHDEDAILAADHVVDIGPGAGVHGGQVIAQGTPVDIKRATESLTGQYLTGTRQVAVPTQRRQGKAHKAVTVRRRDGEQPEEYHSVPSLGPAHLRDGRLRRGQVDVSDRYALQGHGPAIVRCA